MGRGSRRIQQLNEASDVHLAVTVVRSLSAPSQGLSLGHGSARLSASFVISISVRGFSLLNRSVLREPRPTSEQTPTASQARQRSTNSDPPRLPLTNSPIDSKAYCASRHIRGTVACSRNACPALVHSQGHGFLRPAVRMAYGEQVADMIQPFWALPVVAVARISVRRVMGFTVISFLLGTVLFGVALLILV